MFQEGRAEKWNQGFRGAARQRGDAAPVARGENQAFIYFSHWLPRWADVCLCSWLVSLLCREQGGLGRRLNFRCVVEILDVHVCRPKKTSVGNALRGKWEPKRATLLIHLDEMRAFRPERRILCRATFRSYQGIVFGVHPNEALEQIFVLTFGLDLDNVG